MTDAAPMTERKFARIKKRRVVVRVSSGCNKQFRAEPEQPAAVITAQRPQISDKERARRAKGVKYSTGSVRLEGFVVSEFAQALNERYINGEITAKEKTALLLQHYDRQPQ